MTAHRPSRRGRRALAVGKGVVAGGVAALVIGSAVQVSRASQEPGPTALGGANATTSADAVPTQRPDAALQRAMTRHRCSDTGFRGVTTPSSALIVRGGELRHVSFDQGWSVFTGAEPGDLVAVCLSES